MDLRSKVSRDGRVVLFGQFLNGWISGPAITCTTRLRQEGREHDACDPFATFTEWGSAADEAAYAGV
jgi:hypothetical protein